MKYILFFSESGEQDFPYIGKKALNLALLFKKGFRVPPGFIISREVFDEIIRHKQIKGPVSSLFKCPEEEFRERIEEVKDLIRRYRFNEDFSEELVEAYLSLSVDLNMSVTSMLESEEVFVGIRHSFIGNEPEKLRLVQKTILNIKGKERLFSAILETCADKLIQYVKNFRENKTKEEFSIALVVQKMVNADKSGIAYYAGENIVVNACFGLGQDFEYGSVYPDAYIVDDRTLSVRSIDVADKQYEYVKDIDTDETIRHKLGERSTRQVLSEYEITEIARLLKKVVNSFGRQQRIEWAQKKEALYVMKTKDRKIEEQEAVELEVYDEEQEKMPDIIDISEPSLEEDLQALEQIEQYDKEETETGPETEEKSPDEIDVTDITELENEEENTPEIEEIKIPEEQPKPETDEGSIFSSYKSHEEAAAENGEAGYEASAGFDKLADLAKMNAGNTIVYCFLSIKEKLRQRLKKHIPEPPEGYDKLISEIKEYEPLQNESELKKLGNIKEEFILKLRFPAPEEVEMALRLLKEI
ncbi:TPA: hypothetical protein HA239_05355 [Candidatus Woesearchaeota archaeon]|nr:Phosphoenolpyruvate synthase [archaeon GW2011_AR15]MBS3103933.1 hypothetical protein [Candidatus Woesearchaeota archaeon]HIH41809.1 hypothetical protein [Candidatus Woesearchaeota archaeon]